MRMALVSIGILLLTGCGKDCPRTWDEMAEKRTYFLDKRDYTETGAEAAFGAPTLKTADIWRWDVSAGDEACGKWWVEFSPTLTVGREDAFSHPASLP